LLCRNLDIAADLQEYAPKSHYSVRRVTYHCLRAPGLPAFQTKKQGESSMNKEPTYRALSVGHPVFGHPPQVSGLTGANLSALPNTNIALRQNGTHRDE
jgi:hypothetical protein